MSSVKVGLRAVLLATSAVTDLVGAGVYVTRAPQRAALPHIVIRRDDVDFLETLDGDEGFDPDDLIVEDMTLYCVASTEAEVESIEAAVLALLGNFTGAAGDRVVKSVSVRTVQDDWLDLTGSDAGRHYAAVDLVIGHKGA